VLTTKQPISEKVGTNFVDKLWSLACGLRATELALLLCTDDANNSQNMWYVQLQGVVVSVVCGLNNVNILLHTI
jgi:hypothetical protein